MIWQSLLEPGTRLPEMLERIGSIDCDFMACRFAGTRCAVLALPFLVAASLLPASVLAEEVQVGRYASVPAQPTLGQADLLAVLVTVEFPAEVSTVGKAVNHLLLRSGYRLAGGNAADPAQAGLLRLPLPAAHRALGPLHLRTALATLAGPAFVLVEDPVHRLVSFEVCGPDGKANGWVAKAPGNVD